MTWSYNLPILAKSPKDAVRLLIGDTDSTNPLMQDEEINYFLSKRPNTYGTAAECCRSLAVRFSSSATTAAGDTKIAYSDLAKAFAARATAFESQAANSGAGMPYAGGISQADKENQLEDPDRVTPQFALGDDDNFIPVAPTSPNPTQS
jgi:hypothetical protein